MRDTIECVRDISEPRLSGSNCFLLFTFTNLQIRITNYVFDVPSISRFERTISNGNKCVKK